MRYEESICYALKFHGHTVPVEVTKEDANHYFYQQWMTGDTTDNIWGLWKVGPVKAKKILENTPIELWDQTIMDMYQEEDWAKRPENKRPLEMTILA